jgi:hypothetical protein
VFGNIALLLHKAPDLENEQPHCTHLLLEESIHWLGSPSRPTEGKGRTSTRKPHPKNRFEEPAKYIISQAYRLHILCHIRPAKKINVS